MARLRVLLEKNVPGYPSPKKWLEQYRTPPELAISIVHPVAVHPRCGVIVDFGAGTGMLTYAAALVAPHAYIVGIEVDPEAAEAARDSPFWDWLPLVELVVGDVLNPPLRHSDRLCVVENPPFGISSKRGIDLEFLCSAARLGAWRISSLHSYSEESIQVFREKCGAMGYRLVVVSRARFPIPGLYPGHRRRIYYADTVLLVLERAGQ